MKLIPLAFVLIIIGTCSSAVKRETTINSLANHNQNVAKHGLEKITQVGPFIGSISFGPTGTGFIGTGEQRFWFSADSGATWTEGQVPYGAQKEKTRGWFDLTKSTITSSGTIHVIGHLEEVGSAVFTSLDNRKSWTAVTYQSSSINDVTTYAKTSWLVGTIEGSAVVLKNTDEQNWEVLWKQAGSYLTSVHFIDSRSGWTVGASGLILHTTDGGHNWKRQESGTQVMLNSVFMLNASDGFIVGDKGTILQTNDGGLTWSKSDSKTQTELTSVTMINREKVCAIGRSGTVLVSNNNGAEWISYHLANDEDIYALTTSDNHFWIGVSDGTVFRL